MRFVMLFVLIIVGSTLTAQQSPEWQMNCFGNAPKQDSLVCDIRQRVLQEGTDEILFDISFRRFPDASTRLTILSPLGYFLPNGLGLAVDGKEIALLPVDTCRNSGCISVSAVDDEFVRTVRKGSELSVVFWISKQERKEVVIPLAGINEKFLSVE
jgi:invasion protein IalB